MDRTDTGANSTANGNDFSLDLSAPNYKLHPPTSFSGGTYTYTFATTGKKENVMDEFMGGDPRCQDCDAELEVGLNAYTILNAKLGFLIMLGGQLCDGCLDSEARVYFKEKALEQVEGARMADNSTIMKLNTDDVSAMVAQVEHLKDLWANALVLHEITS